MQRGARASIGVVPALERSFQGVAMDRFIQLLLNASQHRLGLIGRFFHPGFDQGLIRLIQPPRTAALGSIAQAFEPLGFIAKDPVIHRIVMHVEELTDGREGIPLGIELDALDPLEVASTTGAALQGGIQFSELGGGQGQEFHEKRLPRLREEQG